MSEYPPEFRGFRGVSDQINTWRRHFPEIFRGAVVDVAPSPLPALAEGRFVLPRWQCLGSTYWDALKTILHLLRISRGFYDYLDADMTVYQTQRNCSGFLDLMRTHGSSALLVVPGQFGRLHSLRSPEVVELACVPGEVPLDLFSVAATLVTHPERMTRIHQLYLLCAGSTIRFQGNKIGVPAFTCGSAELQLICKAPASAFHNFGTPSVFVPAS